MGFLDGIGELLGGFNAQRRIDKEGFDWREQSAQREFERQREQEMARQSDEDRTIGQLGDVLATQEGDPDPAAVESMIPGQVEQGRKKWMSQVALGQLPERKSRIQAAKDQYRQQGREREIGMRGDEAQAVLRVREALAAGREPSPRDKFIAEEAMRRVQTQQQGANYRDATGPGGGSGGAGKWAWNTETNSDEWVTPEKLNSAPTGLYTSSVSGRQAAGQQTNRDAMETITGNLDSALANYEGTQTGGGRFIPSMLSPEKAVAWDRYQSALQSAGQAFGRKVLNDTRVSNEDRQAYAKTIGQTSELMTMLDPTEARRRMNLLLQQEADYEAKYGGDGRGGRTPRAPKDSGVARPKSRAEYNSLPSGALFVAPDGKTRRKP